MRFYAAASASFVPTARKPRTGDSIAVPATRKLSFQPAKALKDALAG